MRNEDLKAELPFMELTGAGDVDLGNGTVRFRDEARTGVVGIAVSGRRLVLATRVRICASCVLPAPDACGPASSDR